MFLVNSRFSLVSATLTPSPQRGLRARAPLLPKLRGHFAEFLDHDYLVRLGILCPTTCVGLGYGRLAPSRRGFSWHPRITLLPPPNGEVTITPHPPHRSEAPGFTWVPGCALERAKPSGPRGYHCASPLLTRLPTCTEGPQTTTHNHHHPPKQATAANVSGSVGQHPRVSMGGASPVREYQPVVHRLRLSASP